jgi:hypothetical protein
LARSSVPESSWYQGKYFTNGVPAAVPHDHRKQFAPRMGIAYSPGDSEKTVIRAGFGMFYSDPA